MKQHHRKHFFEKLPAGTEMVTRPSRWQNPVKVEDYGLEGALLMFRKYLEDNPGVLLSADTWIEFISKGQGRSSQIGRIMHPRRTLADSQRPQSLPAEGLPGYDLRIR